MADTAISGASATKITATIGELTPVEFKGQRVITLGTMDSIHQRPEGTARRNFNNNRDKLVEGEDYFVRNSSEAMGMGVTAPNGLTLLTESGYLLLVKSFTDELAWKVQRQLVNGYFRAHGKDAGLSHTDTITPSEQQNLQELVDAKCRGAADQGKARAEIWSRLHHKFRVAKYNQLPRTQLTEAQLYIMGMQLRGTEAEAQARERITGRDMAAITRVVWQIASSFRNESSWTQGIWFYLRKALNNPSPNGWYVDQLPAISQHLGHLLAEAKAVDDFMHTVETQAVRRILRQGNAADLVVAELERLSHERLTSQRSTLAALPSWLHGDLIAITDRSEPGCYMPHSREQPGYFATTQAAA